MDFDKLKELIEVISNSQLTSFEMEEKEFKLVMKKEKQEVQYSSIPVMPQVTVQPALSQATPNIEQKKEMIEEQKEENLTVITSPIVGTFYASSSPDVPPFVKEGDMVKKGQVLCIIEAMKLMNEIEAECDGKIVKVCVSNETMVEYNQPLFKIQQ